MTPKPAIGRDCPPRSASASTRTALLDAGVALLRDQGIAALTQTRVARLAGLKQSHLTYYFPTRADLLLGIAEHAIVGMDDALASAPRAPLADASATLALAAALCERIIEGVPPRAILGLIVAADAEPGVREALRAFVGRMRERTRLWLASAGLADDADSALLFHASLIGLAVLHQARLDEDSRHEVRRGVSALLQRSPRSADKENAHDHSWCPHER